MDMDIVNLDSNAEMNVQMLRMDPDIGNDMPDVPLDKKCGYGYAGFGCWYGCHMMSDMDVDDESLMMLMWLRMGMQTWII